LEFLKKKNGKKKDNNKVFQMNLEIERNKKKRNNGIEKVNIWEKVRIIIQNLKEVQVDG
jgi:hypothetical protein